jgi:quercetin dioxygenase-like cupin family protein
MNPRHTVLFLIVVAVSLFSCAQEADSPPPEAKPPATAAIEAGPDPAVVDPDHYKIEFENEHVRVIRITYGPGEESSMHYHPDLVAVFLTEQHTSFQLPDGSSEDVQGEAGTHVFMPATQHLPKNIGEQPFEAVAVELKEGPPLAAEEAAGETGPDPTEVDPGHYKAEFENDRVRILRITYGPGEGSPLHYHPAGVAVFLTDQHSRLETPDGSSEEGNATAGEHRFLPRGQHLPKNLAQEPFELLLIELKGT